jgi:hypothetical protein
MAKIKGAHRASMNWKTPQTQSAWVSLPFVLRRQAAQLLGVRASSGRPGYTRGRATIEIAVFGVLCTIADSLPCGAFMLGGDADLNHEKVIQILTGEFRSRKSLFTFNEIEQRL